MMNIQSNMLRGPYMRDIVDRTINEIHDDMVTVFGPNAQDAYLTKNKQPYFTRDGKETIASMVFDNELSQYVLKMLFQAVNNQATKVGDGTTTLSVLYTNLYKAIRNAITDGEFEDRDNIIEYLPFTRKDWDTAIADINNAIKAKSIPMTEDLLLQMLYTCTQDAGFAATIYMNLKEALMSNAYIVINHSDIESDFSMTTHMSPVFKVTRQFSIRPIKDREEKCVILHCNGMLDISAIETFQSLASYVKAYKDNNGEIHALPKTVVLLCNGITDVTRRTTKDFIKYMKAVESQGVNIDEYNNIAIYTLDEYRSYDANQIEDVSTIITDEPGIGGLVNQLTYEAMLFQAFGKELGYECERLETFDCDLHNIDKLKVMMDNPYPVEFDDVKGMRILKTLGPVAQQRYNDLKHEMEVEPSAVRKVTLSRRLRTMYGHFIEVEIGSKLLKDSQRKYELILDAVLSASEGVEKGVLTTNSLLLAAKTAYDLWDTATTDYNGAIDTGYLNVMEILKDALTETVIDMVRNGWILDDPNHSIVEDWIHAIGDQNNADHNNFNLKADNFSEAFPLTTTKVEKKTYTIKDVQYGDEIGDVTLTDQIVEPVSIITTMLENSNIILELASARTFHVESFMQNYI
mgnify:CR=1 FL=1